MANNPVGWLELYVQDMEREEVVRGRVLGKAQQIERFGP